MIELFDDYVIIVDQYNYAVNRRYTKKCKDGTTEEAYRCVGYYSTLVNALNGFRRYLVRKKLSDGCIQLTEAVSTIRDIDKKMEEFITANLPKE